MREPENTPEFIIWLFNSRCIGLTEPCYKQARDIAHIVGRASNDEWRNKVLLCGECHDKWHHNGASDDAIEALKERRAEYLETIGRSEFI